MTEDSLKFQVSQSNNATLNAVYEQCCEEYRKRLCNQWEIHMDSTKWEDKFQDFLYIDFISGILLSISSVIFIVDNNINLSDFLKWWDYGSKNKFCPTMENWFINGIRPKDYEE